MGRRHSKSANRPARSANPSARPVGPNASYGFAEGGSYTRREFPMAFYTANQDTDKLIDQYTWSQAMSGGRFLFQNVPLLRGALLEQCNFSLPLCVHYAGADKDWGKIAQAWVHEWQKNCNVRGPLFNSQTVSRLRLLGRKIDGDIGTLLIRSNKGDFPKSQLIRAHRIRDRYGYGGVIKAGQYKGKKVRNGVVVDDFDRPIAYCIQGEKEGDDQYFSANDMFLVHRPMYGDEFRGFSELCACIRSWADIKRLREYEMRAQQLCASLALIEKNETGYADEAQANFQDNSNGQNVAGTPTGLTTMTFEDGLIRHIKANSGNGLEAFRADRPSADARAWEDKIVGQAFYGIEWDPDFAMCIQAAGGAWVRAKMQKIIRAIANNVAIEAWAQEIEISFAVGQAIRDGVLPEPKDGNFYGWKVSLGVPLPTADTGNDEAAQREAYKLGLTTLLALAARNGGWWVDLRDQREVEVRDLYRRAYAIKADFPELTLQEICHMLEQRDPNVSSSAAAVAAGPAVEEKEAA